MPINGKPEVGSDQHDGWPKPTGKDKDMDHSQITTGPLKAESVHQSHALVGLVLAGENPMRLMNRVIDQIHESESLTEKGGGPYHVGSTVRINTAGTYEKVGGGSQSIGYRDVVSIINPFLGEQGKDAMVLLADGVTRCLVPWKALGESVGWLREADVDTGPDAFMAKPQTGKQLSADSEPQDDAPPKDVPSAQSAGAGSPVTLGGASQVQGDSAPTDEPSARSAGQGTPAVMPGKAVEQRREVLQALDMFMESARQLGDYKKMNEIRRHLESTRNLVLISKVHGMLFSESRNFSLGQVAKVVEQDEPKPDDDDKDNPFPKKPTAERCWTPAREDDNPFPPKPDDDDDEPKEGDVDDPAAGQYAASAEGDDEPSDDDPTKPLQPAEGDDDPNVFQQQAGEDDDEPKPEDDPLDPEKKTEARLRRLYGEDMFPGVTGDSASDGQPSRDPKAGMTGDVTDDAGKKKDPKAGMTGQAAEGEICPVCGKEPCECPPQNEADDDKPDPGKKDFTSPQGEPGKNPSAPGVKESTRDLREGYKKAVSSIFRRLDESR